MKSKRIHKPNVKYSINRQFAFIFIALMSGTILLCWFLNNIFLEEYYIKNKQSVLMDAYENGKQIFVMGNGGSAATASPQRLTG